MFKVLIVDDEPLIRKGLKTIIEWSEYGFYICGEAANGREGLVKAEELKPDLMIVDIKMPGMDGLKMIEQLRAKGKNCSVILLTGYSEFEYAKKGIEFGVDAYILKPIDEDELAEELVKSFNNIVKRKKAEDGLFTSMDRILKRIVTGHIDSSLISSANELYGMNLPWNSYQVVLVKITDSSFSMLEINDRIRKAVDTFIRENNYGYAFNMNGEICLLLENVSFISNIRPAELMQKDVMDTTGHGIVIVAGPRVENIMEVQKSYSHAQRLWEKRFIYGSKKIIADQITDVKAQISSSEISEFNIHDAIDKLFTAVDVNNLEALNNLLERIRVYFIHKDYSEEDIKINYINIYSSLSARFLQSNSLLKDFIGSNEEVFGEIYNKQSLQELHGFIKYKLASISDELAKSRPDSAMKKILDYIDRNYDKEIRLEGLAEIFNYNSSYLGRMFKNHTGESFNTYMDKVRIEKAKQLLKEDFKVYEVAQMTGFNNIDYFYSKFKKYVGVSPSVYKTK